MSQLPTGKATKKPTTPPAKALTVDERRRRNLYSFVEETHFDLVVRLTHFYDFFVETFGSRGTVEDILRVLNFLGWHRLNRSSMEEFITSLDPAYLCPDSTHLDRFCIRHIFREWLFRVSSTPELLHECFKYFDLDNNGYLSKEEIIKILYRTTEEERINLIEDVIEKLDSRIYFNEILPDRRSTTAADQPTAKSDRKVLITKVVTERDRPRMPPVAKSELGFVWRSLDYLRDWLLAKMYRHLLLILVLYAFYIVLMFDRLPPDVKRMEEMNASLPIS